MIVRRFGDDPRFHELSAAILARANGQPRQIETMLTALLRRGIIDWYPTAFRLMVGSHPQEHVVMPANQTI